jgi:hypothetical protein
MSDLISTLQPTEEVPTPTELALIEPLLEGFHSGQLKPLVKYILIGILFFILSLPFLVTFSDTLLPTLPFSGLTLRTLVFVVGIYVLENYPLMFKRSV